MGQDLKIANIFIYFIYTVLLSAPIFLAVIRKFKAKRIGKLYRESVFYFSLLAAFILKISDTNNFASKISEYLNIQQKLENIFNIHEIFYPIVMGMIEIFIAFMCFYLVLNILGVLILLPIMKLMEDKAPFLGKIIDVGIGIFKGIFYIVILTMVIKVFSLPFRDNIMYKSIDQLIVSPIFQSQITENITSSLGNSLKIKIDTPTELGNKQSRIICNGVLLTEALESNEEIDNYAKSLTKNSKTDREKAKALYNYVGNKIEYDNDKAKRISNEDYSIKSGAINTFNTKKGVCFDYACLYAVMAESVGVKSRIVTGEGFSGKEWISHAWIEVYLKEEDKWINVDPTFANAENNFDNKNFNKDHKKEKAIWESSQ